MLHSAGLAIKALTCQTSLSQEDSQALISQRKESFTVATSEYFSLLSSIDVRLRRQVYALEEANIIQAETIPREVQSGASTQQALSVPGGGVNAPSSQSLKDRTVPTNGGLGNLDVGWLNSRNDKVGKEMEAECWEKAKDLTTLLVKEKRAAKKGEDSTEDIDMEHDEVVPITTT